MTFYRRPLKNEPSVTPPVNQKKDYTLWVLVVLIVICAGWIIYKNLPDAHSPYEAAPFDPVIRKTSSVESFQFNNFTITPIATIQITALILGITYYNNDELAELSPVDFAVGWGKMSDPFFLENVSISQSGRWYYWRWKSKDYKKLDNYYIDTHSHNIHIIPGSKKINDVISSVKLNDVVKISGYLISASSNGKGEFISGIRADTSGGGSCFIIWVNEIAVLQALVQ